MCHEYLSQADIKALAKSRGFVAKEITTRKVLENFYLSPTGVSQAMNQLTEAEVACLHLLNQVEQPVTVAYFERLYNPDYQQSYYASTTYTQRYQPVFKQVRTQLIRRGILIMGQANVADSTKMERWRFCLPEAFVPYLPRPLSGVQESDRVGKVRRDVPRGKLLALLGQALTPSPKIPHYELSLQQGQLLIGQRPFQAHILQAWQKAAWQQVMPNNKPSPDEMVLSSLDALTYLLGLLKPNEWVLPESLNTALTIFCRYQSNSDRMCQLGWEWGYLAKNIIDGQSYYRLANLNTDETLEKSPDTYLTIQQDQTALVNLQTIPYQALEQLNQVAYLEIKDWELVARSNLMRMGNASAEVLAGPLVDWLTTHSPAFAETQRVVQARWGKQVLHTNLYVAHVKDLALRVRLERGLKANQIVVLDDKYIAFPPKALSTVKRIVNQAGHVIKQGEAK